MEIKPVRVLDEKTGKSVSSSNNSNIKPVRVLDEKTGKSVKKKSTMASPSEQNQEDASLDTSTTETKKPSVSSGSVDKNLFRGDAGAGEQTYRLDKSSGVPVWKEYSSTMVDYSGKKPQYDVYDKTITDPTRVKTLNKFFKQNASASEVEEVFTGFPGKEANRYRVFNGSWQRMQPNAKEWTTINEDNAITALNRQFKKDIKPIKGLNVIKEGAKFTDINTKLVSQTEGNVVPYLQKKYSKLGFTFEEAGVGQDYVTVTSKDGKTVDVSLDEANPEEALKLRHFISQNASADHSQKTKYLKAKREEDPNYAKTPEYINALKSLSADEVEDLIDERKASTPTKDLNAFYNSEEYKVYKEKKSEKQKERATKVDQLYYELNNAKTAKDKQYIKSKINTFLSDDIIQKQTDGYNMQLMDVQNAYKKINSEYTNLNSAAASGKLTQEQYDERLSKLNQKRVDLKESSDGVIAQMKKLEKVTGKYLLDKEKMGSFGGNLLNSFATGISKIIETPAILQYGMPSEAKYERLSPEEKKYLSDKGYNKEQAINYVGNMTSKNFKNEIREDVIGAIGTKGTTKEYSQSKDRGFFETAMAGVAESLPAMIVPGGGAVRTLAMGSQAYASIEDEMLNDPDFETTSMAERSLIAVPYSVGMGLLEEFGFSKMISKDPLAKSLVMKSLTKVLGKKGTTETLETALEKELKSNITKYGLKVVGGTLAEAETGALQSAILDVGLKTVYNQARNYYEGKSPEEIAELTGGGYFNTPDNLKEASMQILEDAAAEAIGGTVMTAAMTGFEKLSNGDITLFNDEDITKLKDLSSDPEMKKMFVAKLRTDMVEGKITKEQAKTKLEALRSVEADFTRIPEDVTGPNLKKAVELTIEKKDLTKEIEGKDENLVDPKKARIEEINNELKTIGENATKESNKQEVSAEGDIVQREGTDEGQQEVGQGEGAVGETEKPSADTSDSNISSQEEVTPPTQEQIDEDINNKRYATFTYDNESQVPDAFKDKISTVGETNGVTTVRVTVPQSVADYELSKSPQPVTEQIATEETNAQPTIDNEVKEIENFISGTEAEIDQKASRIKNKKIVKSVYRAAKALSKVLPDVKIMVHETQEAYNKAVGEEGNFSNGQFNPKTNTIHINSVNANSRTVAHEVFHAVLLNKVKTDVNAQAITKKLVEAIAPKIDKNPTLKKYLDEFISQYDSNVQNEEKLAEFVGKLADNYNSFTTPVKDIITRWINKLADMFGLERTNDTYDALKTIAGKIASGKEITESDVEIIPSSDEIADANSRFRANFIDPVSKVKFVYDEDSRKWKNLEKDGYITKDKSISDFNGKIIYLHQPDGAFSGMIFNKNGDLLVKGKGGVYYPIKFHKEGFFWASTDSAAKKMAEDLNKIYEQNGGKENGGKILMALTTAPSDKLLSSTTAANAVMEIFKSKAFDENFNINEEQVKESLIEAANKSIIVTEVIKDSKTKKPVLDENGNKKYKTTKVGLGLGLENNLSISEIQSEIAKKLANNKSSFKDRKFFVEELISNIADIVKQNPEAQSQFVKFFKEGIKNTSFKGSPIAKAQGGGLKISKANLTQAISEMLTEPFLKEGVDRTKGGYVYAVLELDGKVEDVSSKKHESYPKAIKIVDGSDAKVKLHILTDRVAWSDVFEDPETNKIITEDRKDNVFPPTSGVSIEGLRLNTDSLSTEDVAPRSQKSVNEKIKEELSDKEINTLRKSLRLKFKDSYIIDVLDSLQDAKKNDTVGAYEEVDYLLENGVNLNYVANTLVEEGNFNSKKEAISYFTSIGEGIGLNDFLSREQLNLDSTIKKLKDKGFTDAAIKKYLENQGIKGSQSQEAIRRYNAVKDNVFLNDPKTGIPKIAQSIKKWSKDQLTTKGNRPNSMFQAQEDMDGVIASHLNKVVRISKDFNKVYNAIPKDLREKFLEDYDSYLRGNKKADISEDAKIVANEMRNQIDALSQNIIDAGLAPLGVEEEIRNNLGSYLTRSYEVFKNKDYKAKEEIIQRAKNLLSTQQLKNAQEEAQKNGTDVDFELNRLVNNEIDKLTNKISADDFLGGGKLGSKSKELGVFKEKTDIPIEIRQLMGEFTDPVQNYAETVVKLSALSAKNDFLNKIKDAGMGVYLFTEKSRPEGYNVQIAAPGSDAMNPLNGLYTTPEIAKEFNNLPGELNNLMKIYMKAISLIKWGKTIGSIMTHGKNLFGNLGFVAVNGHTSGAKDAFKAIVSDMKNSSNEEMRKRIDNYIEIGVMNQSTGMNEIRDMFKDSDFDSSLAERLSKRPSIKNKPVNTVLGKANRIRKSIGRGFEYAYQAEDDFFKILAYESELRRYSKAEFNKDIKDLTETERAKIDKTVSNIVKDTMPTFSRIPKIVKALRRSPLLGNFISFQAESYRTAFKTMQLAKSEITSKNPAIRAIGARRIVGSAIYLSARTALLSYYGSAFGMGLAGLAGYLSDDDEEKELGKDLRKFLPPWATQSDIIPIKNSDGTITYVDMSASDPHGGINKAFNAFFGGDNPIDGAKEAMFSIFKPFLEPEMTAKAMFNLMSGNDNYDRPIWNSEDDWNDMAGNIGSFVWGIAQPGTVTSVNRIIKAEDKLGEIVGGLTGYRPIKVDVGESFGYRVYDYKDRLENAKKLYTNVSYKEDATDEEKEKALEKANLKTEEIYKELMEDYNSAERLGVESKILRTEIKDKLNLSVINLKRLLSGGTVSIKRSRNNPD